MIAKNFLFLVYTSIFFQLPIFTMDEMMEDLPGNPAKEINYKPQQQQQQEINLMQKGNGPQPKEMQENKNVEKKHDGFSKALLTNYVKNKREDDAKRLVIIEKDISIICEAIQNQDIAVPDNYMSELLTATINVESRSSEIPQDNLLQGVLTDKIVDLLPKIKPINNVIDAAHDIARNLGLPNNIAPEVVNFSLKNGGSLLASAFGLLVNVPNRIKLIAAATGLFTGLAYIGGKKLYQRRKNYNLIKSTENFKEKIQKAKFFDEDQFTANATHLNNIEFKRNVLKINEYVLEEMYSRNFLSCIDAKIKKNDFGIEIDTEEEKRIFEETYQTILNEKYIKDKENIIIFTTLLDIYHKIDNYSNHQFFTDSKNVSVISLSELENFSNLERDITEKTSTLSLLLKNKSVKEILINNDNHATIDQLLINSSINCTPKNFDNPELVSRNLEIKPFNTSMNNNLLINSNINQIKKNDKNNNNLLIKNFTTLNNGIRIFNILEKAENFENLNVNNKNHIMHIRDKIKKIMDNFKNENVLIPKGLVDELEKAVARVEYSKIKKEDFSPLKNIITTFSNEYIPFKYKRYCNLGKDFFCKEWIFLGSSALSFRTILFDFLQKIPLQKITLYIKNFFTCPYRITGLASFFASCYVYRWYKKKQLNTLFDQPTWHSSVENTEINIFTNEDSNSFWANILRKIKKPFIKNKEKEQDQEEKQKDTINMKKNLTKIENNVLGLVQRIQEQIFINYKSKENGEKSLVENILFNNNFYEKYFGKKKGKSCYSMRDKFNQKFIELFINDDLFNNIICIHTKKNLLNNISDIILAMFFVTVQKEYVANMNLHIKQKITNADCISESEKYFYKNMWLNQLGLLQKKIKQLQQKFDNLNDENNKDFKKITQAFFMKNDLTWPTLKERMDHYTQKQIEEYKKKEQEKKDFINKMYCNKHCPPIPKKLLEKMKVNNNNNNNNIQININNTQININNIQGNNNIYLDSTTKKIITNEKDKEIIKKKQQHPDKKEEAPKTQNLDPLSRMFLFSYEIFKKFI